MSDDPTKPIENPPGWHVTWGGVVTTLFLMAIAGLLGWVIGTAPDAPHEDRGKFWCNGSTGVYESRDGAAIVPEPYDPACHVDEP